MARACALVIVGTGIGMRDPWPADEPRFASLARDMALSGEWLFPRVGGDLYQDKPPLYFWLLAASIDHGLVRWSFLIPSLLAAGGVLFLIYDLGRRTPAGRRGCWRLLSLHCPVPARHARGADRRDAVPADDPVAVLPVTAPLLGPAWRWYFSVASHPDWVSSPRASVPADPRPAAVPAHAAFPVAGPGHHRPWRVALGLAPLAMLLGICIWFVRCCSRCPARARWNTTPIATKSSSSRRSRATPPPGITKPWYFFLVEVIPALWLPWSLLLFWLVPRWRVAWRTRNARVWLPLGWVLLLLLFFSLTPGKRGIYLHPALPAVALAAVPFLVGLFERRGVKRASFILAGLFWLQRAVVLFWASLVPAFRTQGNITRNLRPWPMSYLFCGAGLYSGRRCRPCSRGRPRSARRFYLFLLHRARR